MTNDNNQDSDNIRQGFISMSINQADNILFILSLTMDSCIIFGQRQIDQKKQSLIIYLNILS